MTVKSELLGWEYQSTALTLPPPQGALSRVDCLPFRRSSWKAGTTCACVIKDYDLSAYGERIADVYDDWMRTVDPTEAVEVLAGLAGEGPVLELGIGTGRIALPLAGRGLEVHGIDASEAMLAKLRVKPGGESISLAIGDMADVAIEGLYSLVFVAANTFFGVLTQEDQVRCFENVKAHLLGNGVFVIEAFVPDPEALRHRGRLSVRGVQLDSVRTEASRHDPVSQTIDGQAIELREQGARFVPSRIRYAWPSELDLMARLAGLRLRERWGGWSGVPFTAASRQHVSLYEEGRHGHPYA